MTGRGWLGVVLVVAAFAALGFGWVRGEGTPPELDAPRSLAVGAGGRDIEVSAADAGSGLRSVAATLVHARGEAALGVETFPGSLLAGGEPGAGPRRIAFRVDAVALGAPEGDAFLRLDARDWSLRGGLQGNLTRVEIPVRVDLHPPRVSVQSGLTYVRRGGSAAVAYSLDEPALRDGVQVGDAFFPGFPAPAGAGRIAIFAVPTDAPPDPAVHVLASDEAGNEATGEWPVVVQERELPQASVELPSSFLEGRVRPLASAAGIPTDDLAQAFQRVNEDLRRANEARIREVFADTAPRMLWSGPFEQLRNSQVTSRFAEHRTYRIGGKELSEATHFGFDLAATQATPITAANSGRVVHAGDLGIYGNCVLIDHGLGVGTLYGHLSRIDVSVGDDVEKGQPIGLSGATGLAGGDHLHFAVMVGGSYVDPLEWWDPQWVRTHVESRLGTSAP